MNEKNPQACRCHWNAAHAKLGCAWRQACHFALFLLQRLGRLAKWMGVGASHRHILFVGENHTTLYLKEIWQRLQEDERLRLWVAFDKELISPGEMTAYEASFRLSNKRVRRIGYRAAMIWPWDLALFADSSRASQRFPNALKKVRTRHGIPAGRLVASGKDTVWSEHLFTKDHVPAFDMIVVPSDAAKADGERACPAYRGRIASVGDLRFDRLLEASRRPQCLRKEFGIPDGKKVVLVISSWGPDSLLQTMGIRLYQQCSLLAEHYHFIISAHPRNYYKDRAWIDVVEKQAQWGATIVRLGSDWTSFMAAADVLVTDHTSMSLYFVPLLKPIICTPLPPEFGAEGSMMYRMERIATRLAAPDRLSSALRMALSSEIQEDHRGLAQVVCSHQGRSWIEMRRRIYELLSLGEPI